MAPFTIVTFLRYYLPGSSGAGPMHSISNMAECLGDDFDFKIITSDRGGEDLVPYLEFESGSWHRIGNANVYYLSPEMRYPPHIRRLLLCLNYDIIYLNSLFSPVFTTQILFLHKLGLIPKRPIVLAPRGELSAGALRLHPARKHLYLSMMQRLGLLDGITWQASSHYEAADIVREAGCVAHTGKIRVASDLILAPKSAIAFTRTPKVTGELRMIFLGRIARNKNLDGALRMLRGLGSGRVLLRIYGPIEDPAYWEECRAIMNSLPRNVEVTYQGEVHHSRVHQVLSDYDLLLFPSHGENFGYVIGEALLSGCPVLTSDQTPWRDLERKGAGWALPLSCPAEFTRRLRECQCFDEKAQNDISSRAQDYGLQMAARNEDIRRNRELFLAALGLNQGSIVFETEGRFHPQPIQSDSVLPRRSEAMRTRSREQGSETLK